MIMGHAATQYLSQESFDIYSQMYDLVSSLNGDCEPFPSKIETYYGQTIHLRNSNGRLINRIRLVNVAKDEKTYNLSDSYSGHVYLDYIAAKCWINTAIENTPASINQISVGFEALKDITFTVDAYSNEKTFARELGSQLSSTLLKNKDKQRIFLSLRKLVKFGIANDYWGFTDELELKVSEVAVKAIGRRERVSMLDHEYGPFTRSEIAQITSAIQREDIKTEHRVLVSLAQKFGLRPIQLALLREDDIYYDKTKLAWYILIPRVKGRVAQLRRTEGNFTLRELPAELAEDIVQLIQEHSNLIETDKDGTPLPRPLFKAQTINKDYLEHDQLKPFAWHLTSTKISLFFTQQLPPLLDIKSMHCKDEDGNPYPLRMNAYRFRYTLGTRMVMEGKTPEEVALALDHSTTASVQHYFKYNQDLIDFIDDTFEASAALKNAALRWQGYFIDEDGSIDGSLIRVSDVLSIGKCLKKTLCEYHPTVSCYGCSRFRPFKDANHQKQLEVIEKEVEFVKNNSTGAVQHQLSEAYEGALQIVEAQKIMRGEK
ncbi:site-specific integrase [Vibrio alginolyticus]|nr:site-specific integrase [Vibrio alginolyticus]